MINFDRSEFYPRLKYSNLEELALLLKDLLIDHKIKNNFEIKDISSLENVRKNSVIFMDASHKVKFECYDIDNICLITNDQSNFQNFDNNVFLINDLNSCYNTLINELFSHDDNKSYKDDYDFINGSYISRYSSIDKSVLIGKNCLIGRGVKVGYGSIIKNNVVIKNSIIGSKVIISDNTCIGSTGFGFDFKKRGASNLNPQIGIVYIDDNCHIGSSCTIDRGKIDSTYLGKNCMIDNLVHIAHNVHISDNACIAAQTGISGSVTIGENVTIGGQVGFAGHINIGKNVIIAAKSGVTKNINDNSIVAGFPAVDIKKWKRNIIRERNFGRK